MKSEPRTIAELIDAFGGPTGFAEVIGKNPSTASEMKRSGRVKVAYWPAVVRAAPKHEIPGVTFESIARMHITTASAA